MLSFDGACWLEYTHTIKRVYPSAADFIVMSSGEAGLPIDALQQFSAQQQVSVNLSRTKTVTLGTTTPNSSMVKRLQMFICLGFLKRSTLEGLEKLASAAKKAMHSVRHA